MSVEYTKKLGGKDAVLLVQNLFLRERFDWQMWDLRQMGVNVAEMKKIVEKASWESGQDSKELLLALESLAKIIKDKDATRVIAGHTHVEQALEDLRDRVFGIL